jgi:hypothetical protein
MQSFNVSVFGVRQANVCNCGMASYTDGRWEAVVQATNVTTKAKSECVILYQA